MEKVQKGTAKIITGLDNMPDVKHTRSSLQLMKKAAGRFVCSLITYRREKKKKTQVSKASKKKYEGLSGLNQELSGETISKLYLIYIMELPFQIPIYKG